VLRELRTASQHASDPMYAVCGFGVWLAVGDLLSIFCSVFPYLALGFGAEEEGEGIPLASHKVKRGLELLFQVRGSNNTKGVGRV